MIIPTAGDVVELLGRATAYHPTRALAMAHITGPGVRAICVGSAIPFAPDIIEVEFDSGYHAHLRPEIYRLLSPLELLAVCDEDLGEV